MKTIVKCSLLVLVILCCLFSCEKDIPCPCQTEQTFTLSFRNSGNVLALIIDWDSIPVQNIKEKEFTISTTYSQIYLIQKVWVDDPTGYTPGEWVIQKWYMQYQNGEWIRPNACATFNLWK